LLLSIFEGQKMRYSQYFLRTKRDSPRNIELISHKYLLRAGFLKQYASGLYGYTPIARKTFHKIEQIIREEMAKVGGQEILMPCLATKDLWEESGRYSRMGTDMFRLQDRQKKEFVLNMTHEESVVSMIRQELTSYKHLPVILYQIQTKFRDELRPRGGIIRLREFSMKDAYSFHETEESLAETYQRMHGAYEQIFYRCGFKKVISVQSDNGLFGGHYSHEFQLRVHSGEDTVFQCPHCHYSANLEVASSTPPLKNVYDEESIEKISTPHITTIEGLCNYLNIESEQTAKAVLYKGKNSHRLIICFIRGDRKVSEQKVKKTLQEDIRPAKNQEIFDVGAFPGFTGAINLKMQNVHIIVDQTLVDHPSVVIGANEKDCHYRHFNFKRDVFNQYLVTEKPSSVVADILAVQEGDPCPKCQKSLTKFRGIEVANIFHLGTKYSEQMKASFVNSKGRIQPFKMACYGIGVTRLLASVVEEHHDEHGIIFPLSIAPFAIYLCVIQYREASVKKIADSLYNKLQSRGLDVLFDDRDQKPGVQFSDADLIGLPVRMLLSPKTISQGEIEIKLRKNHKTTKIPIENSLDFIENLLK